MSILMGEMLLQMLITMRPCSSRSSCCALAVEDIRDVHACGKHGRIGALRLRANPKLLAYVGTAFKE
jgi:hypothetical protein